MSLRKKPDARCPRCLMRCALCFCGDIPNFNLKTRIILISRPKEIIQPSNTARFVPLILPNSSVYLRGLAHQSFQLDEHVQANRPSYLLYPDPSAPILEKGAMENFPEGINLIVPDGNWRQTSKLRRREKSLIDLPTLQVQPQMTSLYRIRTERKASGLATLEAIAYALGVLEGEDVKESLLKIVKILSERTFIARGIREA